MLRCTCMVDVAGQKGTTQESAPMTSDMASTNRRQTCKRKLRNTALPSFSEWIVESIRPKRRQETSEAEKRIVPDTKKE
jgi:hypothetical protein